MPAYYDQQKRRWRYRLRRVLDGRLIRTSRLLPKGWSRDQAERYGRETDTRLLALAAGVERQEPLIDEAVAAFLQFRLPTLKNGKKTAGELALALPWYEGRPLSDLPAVCREFAAQAKKVNGEELLSKTTVRNRLAYLRAAAHYAWKHHQIGSEDWSRRMVVPTLNNARHVYLEPDEVAKLLEAMGDEESRALVRLIFYTGLRWVKELLPREPGDVVRSGSDLWLSVPDTKNKKPRMVWLHPGCHKDLEHLPFPLHWRTYYTKFERARKKIKRPGLRLHDLRHSFASYLISQGATLAEVGAALGHSSAQSTARYAHLYPQAVARVVRSLPTLPRRKRPA